jgi:hypothetical protein
VAFMHDPPEPHAVGISASASRRVRLIPARSSQWVVLYVMRDALHPDRIPASTAARLLLDQVPDPVVLRHARARLRNIISEHATVPEARAVATLNLAIARLEDDSQHNAQG